MNLNARYLGVPLWGWFALAVAAGGYFLWRRSKAGATSAAGDTPSAPGQVQGLSTGALAPAPTGVVSQPDYQMGIPLVAVAVTQPGAPGSAQTSQMQNVGGQMANTAQSGDITQVGQLSGDLNPTGDGGGVGTGAGSSGEDCAWKTDPSGKSQYVCPSFGTWVSDGSGGWLWDSTGTAGGSTDPSGGSGYVNPPEMSPYDSKIAASAQAMGLGKLATAWATGNSGNVACTDFSGGGCHQFAYQTAEGFTPCGPGTSYADCTPYAIVSGDGGGPIAGPGGGASSPMAQQNAVGGSVAPLGGKPSAGPALERSGLGGHPSQFGSTRQLAKTIGSAPKQKAKAKGGK